MERTYFIIFWIVSLLMAPLLPGIINKVKAFFAGRRGPSVFQQYRDLIKLVKKECVISASSGGIIRLAPSLLVVFTVVAAALLPAGRIASPLNFYGDALLFFYLLGSCRVLSVLAALDTGSSFEGMGASREVFFSALAEAVVFAVLAFLALSSESLSLFSMLYTGGVDSWIEFTPLVLVFLAMFLVLLAENCRVPFDDPDTHLELTMIHEAMILDYSGADLAAVFYAASVKLWIFGSFIVTMLLPPDVLPLWGELAVIAGGTLLCAVLVGVVESSMARYRFLKVPPLLLAGLVMAVLAMLFHIFFKGGAI